MGEAAHRHRRTGPGGDVVDHQQKAMREQLPAPAAAEPVPDGQDPEAGPGRRST
ncbi:hypothetical protein ACFWMX_22140 [Streptomyces sp. NPDC058378]|uniref:hypothetical protein n=1 Tax=unclassified Streptomyces TaxID=2593676 RepID=UPI00365B7AD3